MKKWIAGALALLLAVSLAGCGTVSVEEVQNVEASKPAEGQVRILTQNVYYGGSGSHKWEKRAPYLVAELRAKSPDSFGLQEALQHWMDYFAQNMPEYACVGVARDDGKQEGEYNPIFYNKEKYEALDSGTFWLTDTPDVPSIYPGAGCNRICTWVILQDKATGGRYAHFNTHLDNVSEEARVFGAKLVRERIDELVARENIPVVCTGDFNVDETSSAYATMTDGHLGDTRHLAGQTMQSYTWHDFKPRKHADDGPIDYIFVYEEKAAVHAYQVLNHKVDGKYASDHYGVYADMTLAIQ